MKWMKYSLKTTTEAVDLISDMLNEMGFEGIEIEDHVPLSEADKQKMFVDILPETEPDDGTATVNFYVEPPESSEPFEAAGASEDFRKNPDEVARRVHQCRRGDAYRIRDRGSGLDQQLEGIFPCVPDWRGHCDQTVLAGPSGGGGQRGRFGVGNRSGDFFWDGRA